MGFAPKITPENIKTAFVSAEGWGSFEQQRSSKSQTGRVEIKHGKLHLKTFRLQIPTGWNLRAAKVSLGEEAVRCSFSQQDDRITIDFTEDLELTSGQVRQVQLDK